MPFNAKILQKLNHDLDDELKDCELDFARFYTPTQSKKVSIVCTYNPFLDKEPVFVGFTPNLAPTIIQYDSKNDNFEYGISTKISATKIVNAISNLQFQNNKGLQTFIEEHYDCFMLHSNQLKYLNTMAKYFVLSMTYNYCVKFKFINNDLLSDYKNEIAYDKDSDVYSIIGCPSENLINVLKNKKFKVQNDIAIEIFSSDEDEDCFDITRLYKEANIISLYDTKVFYSGSLLRPLQIVQENRNVSNNDVTTLNIHFEKSSFATVYAFDNDKAKFHNLITPQEKQDIDEFFEYEDAVMRKLCNETSQSHTDSLSILNAINQYLKDSYNVHQICVSANITSLDNILTLAFRDKTSIDGSTTKANSVYPSVNGNAEILVPNIDFYTMSSNEDIPKIKLDDSRIDFNMELSRETYAELKLEMNPMLWDFYGISINGSIPPKKPDYNEPCKRRMHFNVLASQKCNYTFKELCQLQTNATEAYETKNLAGLKVKTFKNAFSAFAFNLKKTLEMIVKNSSFLTAILTLFIFFDIADELRVDSVSSIKDIFSYIVAILLVVVTCVNFCIKLKAYLKYKKYIKNCSITQKNWQAKSKKILTNMLSTCKIHPATYVLLKLHFIQSCIKHQESINKKTK